MQVVEHMTNSVEICNNGMEGLNTCHQEAHVYYSGCDWTCKQLFFNINVPLLPGEQRRVLLSF